MPQILMPYTVHLDHTLRVTPMNTLFAKGDSDAHRFELTILRSGVQDDLTGCAVFGKFYRMADSTVVSVPGSVEDGKAVVVLDAACYDYIGRFALTIAIKKGEDKTTVFYGDGYMHGQRADTAISGEYIIYDINTLLEKIAEIDAATQAANTATENANTAASNANTARDAANTAASTANTAATNANTAKDAANAAAGKLSAMTVSATPVSTGTATAELSTVDGHYHLALGLPKGDTGATPQISVQVQTGEAGSEASVSVSGTAEAPVILLTIPRGDVGDIGNLTINGKAPDDSGAVTLGMGDISGLSDAIANAGGVKTVAGVGPDSAGNVALTASDVGARASSWTPTAAEVGARPSSWTPTAAEVGALAVGGTAADSSKLGGKAPEYYIQPRNLLDNSDFRNPVNQRGVSSGTLTGWNYFIDRWRCLDDCTYELTDDGIRITGGAISQSLAEGARDNGKTYTFAVCLSTGTIRMLVYTLPETDVSGWTVFNNKEYTDVTLESGGDSKNYNVLIKKNSDSTIRWAALYEGSYTVDTLPPYVPKGYEIISCREYYREYGDDGIYCYCYANDYLAGFIFDIPMRIAPNISECSILRLNGFVSMSLGDSSFTTAKGVTYIHCPGAVAGEWYRITSLKLNAEM